MKIMRSIKGISVFLTLAVSLLASTIGAQAQISSGAPTKLVLINSFNDFASVQPAQNQNSVVVVRYGNTVGDQLGGMFAYDPDSVAAGDSKNVFVPASGVGRFVRYDYAAYVPGVNTANRVLVTDGSGNVGTDPQLTFNGADLTVGGNLTVTTIGAGSTDNIVTKSAGNVLQTRQVNPDVWNLAADLAGDSENLAAGTKLTSPAIYFDGSNDYLEVADSDKLSFQTATGALQGTWSAATNTPFLTDGVGTSTHYYVVTAAGTQNLGSGAITYAIGDTIKYDGSIWSLQQKDDLPFSVSAWVKMEDATNFSIIGKNDGSPVREYQLTLDGSDKLQFSAYTDNLNYRRYVTSSALTSYEESWVHVAATYAGAGPNSGVAFSSALPILYINGQSVALSDESAGTYAGMSDTAKNLWLGRTAGTYAKGHIRNVQLFNRELTATEVAQLARGTDLGFADEWGGALGGVYTSDFSAGADGWNIVGTLTRTGNIDSVGPGGDLRDDTLRLVPDATNGAHAAYKSGLSYNKRYRISFDYYIPSTNSNVDSFNISLGSGNFLGAHTATLDAWTSYSVEGVCAKASTLMILYLADGGSTTFADAGSDDTLYIRNVKFTEIGTLADFRAENFDSDTGKIYDISDNAFVGTSANLPTLTGRAYPVYETGTWTPTLTGSTTTDFSYTTQEGYYTRTGNTVFVRGTIVVSALGTSAGNVEVSGLPFTSSSDGASSSVLGVYALNMATLTSQVIGLVGDGTTTVALLDSGASGVTQITTSNLTATSTIKFSGTYQIQ